MSARRLLQIAVVLVCVFAVASAVVRSSLDKSGSPSPSPAAPASAPASNPPSTPTSTVPRPAGADSAGVVWLCKPGLAANPCEGDLSTTVIDAAYK